MQLDYGKTSENPIDLRENSGRNIPKYDIEIQSQLLWEKVRGFSNRPDSLVRFFGPANLTHRRRPPRLPGITMLTEMGRRRVHFMTLPHHDAEKPITQGDCSQLWLRQRPLRPRPPAEGDDGRCCACRQAATKAKTPISEPIESTQLLAGRREVRIVHAGETYRLLVTRNNKLILHK